MENTKKNIVTLPFGLAMALAAATGFIALAYEILWTRLYNFGSGSRAQAFGAMLGSYLLGLAIGSLLSRRWQRADLLGGKNGWRTLSRLVVISNAVGFLVVPLTSWIMLSVSWVRALPLVMAGAALLGTILPLLCHLAIPADDQAGARMSYLYLANIFGSGAGSLLTGFVLMDWLRLWQIASVLLIFAVLVSLALAHFSQPVRKADYATWGATILLACSSPLLHDGLFERLQWGGQYKAGMRFAQIVESRHGVVTVDTNRLIYGNSVYDGIIDTRLQINSGLVRPYLASALHPDPKEVLVVGMSAGAWTQILAHHPQVERVTAVEINKAYLKVIEAYPQVSSLLSNPKVEIVIDDGRRWLRRHPDRRFDVIAMNTSFHWREFAGALLSKEFLELTRDHLRPGGYVMWNCTSSARAARTGMEVFPYTLMVGNNCVGSLSPLGVDKARWASNLSRYRIDGRPVFDVATPAGRKELADVVAFLDSPANQQWRLMERTEMEAKYGQAQIITDDNLGEEYRATLRTFLASLVPGLNRLFAVLFEI